MPAAIQNQAAKRADYETRGACAENAQHRRLVFAWHEYDRADQPDTPTVYRPGDLAEAEPAVPGWRISVDEVFA